MNILEALAQGKSIQEELPGCLRTTLKSKLTPIAAALEAPLSEISQYLLGVALRRLEAQDGMIEEVEGKLYKHLSPHKAKLDLLLKIPGIQKISAHIILAEIGVDMTAWPTEKHFSAWAGVAPGCNQTGGKSKRGKTRKGNPYLCTALMECAGAAVKTQTCHLKAKYHKLCAQVGSKKKARTSPLRRNRPLLLLRNRPGTNPERTLDASSQPPWGGERGRFSVGILSLGIRADHLDVASNSSTLHAARRLTAQTWSPRTLAMARCIVLRA
jgi:hypothetical protein